MAKASPDGKEPQNSFLNKNSGPRLHGDGSLLTTRKRSWSKLAGFTLLELSIVLAIIGTVTVGMVSMGGSMVESSKRVNTTNKLDAIEVALMAYRIANNRLPCPSNPALTDSAANAATYGYESGTPGTCTGTNITTATISSVGNTVVAEGAVPVRTLSLPDEYQFDGWGRKFAYAVWTPITAAATSTSSPAGFMTYGLTPNCGAVTVENAGHGYRTQLADYALISYGPDGHGGYLKTGTRYNAGVSNLDEVANAHYSSGGADTGAYTATYIQKDYSLYTTDSDANHPFGHIIRYKERWQMQNDYDTYHPSGDICSQPGFRADGFQSSQYSGYDIAAGDVNCDGITDLVISDIGTNKIYVVFGTSSGFPNPLVLNTLNGTNGFTINLWTSVQSVAVGNLDGDTASGNNCNDIAIGTGSGDVAVFFGHSGSFSASYDHTAGRSSFNGCDGFDMWDGSIGCEGGHTAPNCGYAGLGSSVAFGDINGDGIQDLIMGYADGGENDDGGTNGTERVYAIFGKTNTCTGAGHTAGTATFTDGHNAAGRYDIEYLNANNAGFYVIGEHPSNTTFAQVYFSNGVVTGDVYGHGNGMVDVVVGDDYEREAGATYSGTLYVLFGHTDPSHTWWPAINGTSLGALNGTNGFRLQNSQNGIAPPNGGYQIGDFNGDGKQDILIGNGYSNTTGCAAGGGHVPSASIIWGGQFNTGSATYNVTNIFGVNGKLTLVCMDTAVDTTVSIANQPPLDLNGDGYKDPVISYYSGPNPYGSTYVLFGHGGAWPTTVDLYSTPLNGANGVRIDNSYPADANVSNCYYPPPPQPLGLDMTGSGTQGIAIPLCDSNGDSVSGSGYTYVLFGKRSGWTATYPLSNIY